MGIYEETILEFNNAKELVEKILKEDERARNSDKWLTYRCLQAFAKKNGYKIFIPFELFKLMPSFESWRRSRCIIQNVEGKYPPTDPEVLEKRGTREKAVRDWSRW